MHWVGPYSPPFIDDFLYFTKQNRGNNNVDSILELPMASLRGRPYSSWTLGAKGSSGTSSFVNMLVQMAKRIQTKSTISFLPYFPKLFAMLSCPLPAPARSPSRHLSSYPEGGLLRARVW